MGATISKVLPSRGGVKCSCESCCHGEGLVSTAGLDEVLPVSIAETGVSSTIYTSRHGEVVLSTTLPAPNASPVVSLTTYTTQHGEVVLSTTLPTSTFTFSSNLARDQSRSTTEMLFRFLDLPPELRNMIYEELLFVGKVYFKGTDKEHANSARYKDKAYYQKPSLKLFRVCKQIHQEAEPVYLMKNLFVLPLGWQAMGPFRLLFGGQHSSIAIHLFSENALRQLRNLSIAFDIDAHKDLKLSSHQWKNNIQLKLAQDLPEDQRLGWIHDYMIIVLKDGLNQRGFDGTCSWDEVGKTLRCIGPLIPFDPSDCENWAPDYDPPEHTLDYIEIDYTNAYCPLGCCRPVWLINHGWMHQTIPTKINIVGWEPREGERYEIKSSMANNDKLDLAQLDITFRSENDPDPWRRWKCERPQRYVPVIGFHNGY